MTDEQAEIYAQGFAWSLHGIAGDVTEQIVRMLPHALVTRLPVARAAFEALHGGPRSASRTSVPHVDPAPRSA